MIDLIEEIGIVTKKKASTNGGEYFSPCPFCKDGKDRFLIWPNQFNKNGEYQGGRFLCRVCNKYGDAITFIRELHRLSYKEACEKLKIQPKKRNATFITKKEIVLPIAKDPPDLWKSKGESFVEWCHSKLMADPSALALLYKRGFNLESIIRFKLGFNPKNLRIAREDWELEPQMEEDGDPKKLWLPAGIVIPSFSNDQVVKIKIRRSNLKEGDNFAKYIEVSGSKRCLSVYGDSNIKVALIIESELDAVLVQQEAGDLVYCVALGGATKPLDYHTGQLLRHTPILLFCPDFDEAGKKAWDEWKKMFPYIQRILTPDLGEGKSAGDAYLAGVNLREWIVDSLESFQVKN